MKKLDEFEDLEPHLVYVDGGFLNLYTVESIEYLEEASVVVIKHHSGENRRIQCIDDQHALDIVGHLQRAHDAWVDSPEIVWH